MLPKINVNGNRGAVQEVSRFRLLKWVGNNNQENASQLSPLPKLPSEDNFGRCERNVPPGREPQFDSAENPLPPRKFALLRPLHAVDKPHMQSPLLLQTVEHESEELDPATVLQQHACERVRQHHRRRKRKAREEEERRVQEEKERMERIQKAIPQIEAHRQELARHAANLQCRERAAKISAEIEQKELLLVRRERKRDYMTPAKIRKRLRRKCDQNTSCSETECGSALSIGQSFRRSGETDCERIDAHSSGGDQQVVCAKIITPADGAAENEQIT